MNRVAPFRLRRRASWALGAMLLALSAANCKSDHDALRRRPVTAGSSGSSGASAAGSGGKGGSFGGSSSVGGSSATGGGGSGGQKMVEPPGRSVTTLVHGIVDAERVAWCFGRGTGDSDLKGEPAPRRGLAYGESFTFEKLDGFELEKDDVSVFALTGELDLVDDLDCEHAVARAREEMAASGQAGTGGSAGAGGSGGESTAGVGGENAGEAGAGGAGGQSGESSANGGVASETARADIAASGVSGESGAGGAVEPTLPPPRLRVAAVAGFPAGSLSDGYSLLLVAAGCIGGPSFTDSHADEICGDDYDPRFGNVTAELAVLSRHVAPGKIALQGLHASHASGDRGIYVVPPPDAVLSTITIADGLSEGTLRPRDPRVDLGPSDYGIGSEDFSVQVYQSGSLAFQEFWPAILERSGLDGIEVGRGYTLILMGPSSGRVPVRWWNGRALTLVDNDPGGEGP